MARAEGATARPVAPMPDAAEREARILGRRLSLTGAVAGGGAQQTPDSPPPRRREPLRQVETGAVGRRALAGGAVRGLDRQERALAEEALGYDMAAVRIHYGGGAQEIARQNGAAALTIGTHILLGAAALQASALTRAGIIAHELIHVVQQAAPRAQPQPQPLPMRHARPAVRGPPQAAPDGSLTAPRPVAPWLCPLIRAPPQVQCLSLDEASQFAGSLSSTAARYGTAALEGAMAEAEGFAADAREAPERALRRTVDLFAPGLWVFLSGGAMEMLTGSLCEAVDAVLARALDGLAGIDLMTSIEATFQNMAASVTAMQARITLAAREAVGTVFEPLIHALDQFGDPILSFIESATGSLSRACTGAWDRLAVPALNLMERAGGAVWRGFTTTITWLWELIAPLREAADWAWQGLCRLFRIAWNSTSDIRQSLAGFAERAWTALQASIAPIRTPLMLLGGILLMITPGGQVLILSQIIPPVYDKISWLVQNWRSIGIVVEAREILHKEILPAIIGAAGLLGRAVQGAVAWLGGMAGQMATAMLRLVGLCGGIRCLVATNRMILRIEAQVLRFQAWAQSGFAGLGPAIVAAAGVLRAVFAPILDFLTRLMIVAASPGALPVVITATIWLLLPERLKPPVIRFVLRLLIALVQGMSGLMIALAPLNMLLREAILGFLRYLTGEGVSDEMRLGAANRIASLAAGAGAAFAGGFVLGLLQGMIEGILDPLMLIFMLIELVVKGLVCINRVIAGMVARVAPEASARIGAAVNGQLDRMTRPLMHPEAAGAAPAAQGAAVAGDTAPPAARAPPGAAALQPALAAPIPEGELSATGPDDAAILARMPQAALTGVPAVGDFAAGADTAALQVAARGEISQQGASVGGLAAFLGEAWAAMMQGAARVGGMVSGWLLQFLLLPDYEMGNKIGWLTGMILLELLIAWLTAGGYVLVKEGAGIGARLLSWLLRYLDMGGAILGVLGKGLAKLRGPFRAAMGSKLMQRMTFLRGMIARVEASGEWLFRFGDQLGEAAALARRGHAGDAATNAARRGSGMADGAAHLGDDAAGGATRLADDLADPAAVRALRGGEPPVPAARAVPDAAPAPHPSAPHPSARGEAALEDLGGGTRRTLDEPGHPTVPDEALRASEYPRVLAMARQIAEANDLINAPVPVVLGELMLLKTRHRWIDYFTARPKGPPGVYEIGMVASPLTPVDPHYSVFEMPDSAPPRRAADPTAWRQPPEGARLVSEGPHHMVYELPDGTQRIRFEASEARTLQEALPGRNQTSDSLARVSADGRPYVDEGRHRAIGAAKGDVIPPGQGGVDGHPGILDYEYSPGVAPGAGRDVRDLAIDYDVPDMDSRTLRDFTEAGDATFRDPNYTRLSEADRGLGSTGRGQEIAGEITASPASHPPAAVQTDPAGVMRADPTGHPPRANEIAKTTQLPQAISAAHFIVATGDRLNLPMPVILGQLMALKAHYRWIDTFEVRPIGPGRYHFFLIASRFDIGTADLNDLTGPLPRGAAVHADEAGTRVTLPGRQPEVITRSAPGPASGSKPGAAAEPLVPLTPAPVTPAPVTPAPVTPASGRDYQRDDILAELDEVSGGTSGLSREGRAQAPIPGRKSWTEFHTDQVLRVDRNRGYGAANEGFLNRFLDTGQGAAPRFDRRAEQLRIRPILGFDGAGQPIVAEYWVIADNVVFDNASGGLHILDGKTTLGAPFTGNQQLGYPLIRANGGVVASRNKSGAFAWGTVLPPMPVTRAVPDLRLADEAAALPAGGIGFQFFPL